MNVPGATEKTIFDLEMEGGFSKDEWEAAERNTRTVMADIASGGTGEAPVPCAVQVTTEARAIEIVGPSAPYHTVVRLIRALEAAEERGRGSAGATRDELAATRARLEDAEARRRREVDALLSDLQELPSVRRKLEQIATMARVNESRAEHAEKHLAILEQSQLQRVADHGQSAGILARTQEELRFAQEQIQTLHTSVVSLQSENANFVDLLAQAMEKVDGPKKPARRRKAKRRP